MKVNLLQDVKGTGKKDQIVEASDGFARNYLIPRKMAREATAEALNAIEKSKSADKHREDVRRAEAETKARMLKGKVEMCIRDRITAIAWAERLRRRSSTRWAPLSLTPRPTTC